MTENELLAVLALQNVPNIGSTIAKKLIAHCGSAEAVFKEKRKILSKINGIGQFALQGLHDQVHFDAAELELRFIKDEKVRVHYFLEDNYPRNLKHCIDGPALLFSKGHINLENKRIISIVGSRKATNYGLAFCDELVEMLLPYNPVIVSGFAYGIDIAAQKAALNHNLQTIGCLAHGLNQIYPKAHSKYVNAVENHGGFFTDFWSTDVFDRNNFLKRNRIIAGLSEATIVIESAEKGGSLVTADIANSYDRDVFALPGRASDNQSKGCNNLIKTQQAHLLSNPLDVPYILGWQLEPEQKPSIQKKMFVELNPEERVVFNFLKNQDKEQLDVIAIKCNIPTFKLAGILLNMELKGVVRPLPGKQFQLI
ncbi:DNA-processing protein DprA [Winogradskyella aurantiaca]|uniref:DNA-processing protein DprA n=1 Tax=Winogradskyella aurantiaca TaxID=2219558 RepID=UPI000E1DE4BD|nr:DNA-processing protein DprA [Winogradskyella aurantiaca]